METPIYMRDLKKEMRTDIFLGEGTEELIKKADKEDKEIVVGYFLDKFRLE